MRTTLDLPDPLVRRAKIAAVERGVTLRELVRTALAKELDSGSAAPQAPPSGLRLPIFPSHQPGSLTLTNADLARGEAVEDVRRHGPAG